jgi:hypothetical protein
MRRALLPGNREFGMVTSFQISGAGRLWSREEVDVHAADLAATVVVILDDLQGF